ncbi:hypothetical protein Y032_0201g1733 [Ancylostoma ceylanicum]|uniref:Uncharacterized protein n=1 Tax=Ancylostoma ceylanicum TaxID=53326 RepID=A0A016SNA7_9BILA|nr:hypothetical protein Y032_0201g1733 [Ancylostoma ceylanicum]
MKLMNAVKIILLVAMIWLPTIFFFSRSTPSPVQENYAEMEGQVEELQRNMRSLQEINRDLKNKLTEIVIEQEAAWSSFIILKKYSFTP